VTVLSSIFASGSGQSHLSHSLGTDCQIQAWLSLCPLDPTIQWELNRVPGMPRSAWCYKCDCPGLGPGGFRPQAPFGV